MSYVYVAPLKDGSAFKIGKAKNAMDRLTELSFYYRFDTAHILVIDCQNESEAFLLEAALHKIFDQDVVSFSKPGGTEFFATNSMPSVIKLCEAICEVRHYKRVPFLPNINLKPPGDAEVIQMTCSESLKAMRLNANISQAELATKANVSKRTVERFETGSDVGMLNFIKIANALGVAQSIPGTPQVQSRKRGGRTRAIFVGDSDHEPEKEWVQNVTV